MDKHLYRIFVRQPQDIFADIGEEGKRVFYAWLTPEEKEEFRQELKERGYAGVRFTFQKGSYVP